MTTPPPDPIDYILNVVQSTSNSLSSRFNDIWTDWSHNVKDWVSVHDPPILKDIINPRRQQPHPIQPPSSSVLDADVKNDTLYYKVTDWIWNHKVISGIIIIGSSSLLYSQYLGSIKKKRHHRRRRQPPPATPSAAAGAAATRRHHHHSADTGATTTTGRHRKRRAQRAPNGARTQVVVITGWPCEPVSKAVVADLERRGFIIFCIVCNSEQATMVNNDGNSDIRPLPVDPSDASSINQAVDWFSTFLDTPGFAFPGAIPHRYQLAGIILLPDTYYPSGPIETLGMTAWSDALFNKLFVSIAILSQGFIPLCRNHKSSIIFMTPTIIPSLVPPFHGIECVISQALDTLSLVLYRELKPHGVNVLHIRLGSFDLKHHVRPIDHRQQGPADILSWPETARNVYAHAYTIATNVVGVNNTTTSTQQQDKPTTTGSSLARLHWAVFDALSHDDNNNNNTNRVRRVGRGSLIYELIGNLAPNCFIEWLFGSTRFS